MVGLRIIIVAVKLDSRYNYAKIQIFLFNPCLDRIKYTGTWERSDNQLLIYLYPYKRWYPLLKDVSKIKRNNQLKGT
jgi:hypothetical protein